MTKNISFRVKRIYFDAIIAGTKKVELRALTPYWDRRLLHGAMPKSAVFVCGKDLHRRKIIGISVDYPHRYLGRPLTADEKEIISTRLAIGIHLGAALE